jgi:RNA polymerase sigma-70 factor (ECF subfamily)
VSEPTAAFDRLYDGHVQAVHAYLLARTREAEVAQDLVQETFLRAWRHLGGVAGLPPSRQRAWLVAVARNLVVDRSRRDRTQRDAAERLGHLEDGIAPRHAEPEHRAELTADVAAVDAAVAALPEEQRVILSLRVLGELTSAEIGELLEQPAGTVRYKLNQARQRLRAAMPEEERA